MVASEITMKGAGVNEFDATKAKLVSKRRRVTLPQWATAWIVLIPALIFICMFMLYPIVNTIFYSFMQDFTEATDGGSFALIQFVRAINGNNPKHAIYAPFEAFGLDNFKAAFEDPVFMSSIGNTAILTIVEVPLTIIVSLLIATFLNNIKVLKGFYQTIFFLPYVTNTIALGLVFQLVFKGTPGGLMNIFLNKVFGVKDPINWLSFSSYDGGPTATKFTEGVVIVINSLWNGIAFKILVFMSGLATIDKQYSDAARIDGASSFTIWRRITLPLLSPQILYITITSFIGAFKMYTGPMSVFMGVTNKQNYFGGEGKGNDWITVVGWIYRYVAENPGEPGVASAASLILLGIIMVITAVQFGVSKTRVHY